MGGEVGQRGVLLRLVSLTGDEIRSLADAMVAVPVMRSPNSRQQVLEFVKERNRTFDPRRSDRDTVDVVNLITACQADDESFDLLLEAIETRTSRDDPKLYKLKQLIETLLPRALLTAEELRELLVLNPDTVAGPDKLAVGMRRAVRGQTSPGSSDFKPSNIREAMLLLLDGPSPEEGLLRLLRFVDWLAQLTSILEEDSSTVGQMRELADRVGRAHGMPVTVWQSPAEPMRNDVADAASAIDAQQVFAEDVGARDRLHERRSKVSWRSVEIKNRERAVGDAQGREERRYLVGDNNSALVALGPHQQSLRDLGIALKRVQPIIFRDPRIRSRELGAARKALESVGPLMVALSEVAREESEQPMRDDLLQLEDDLRKHLEALSRELSALSKVRSPGAARKLCNRLADEAVGLLDTGAEAIRHVT
jgi:hypothetical protein